MIRAVPPREDKPAGASGQEANGAASPLRMIPVMADDVAREKRRRLFIWLGAVLAILVIGAVLYKRFSDPRDAQEAYDAGMRLMKATRYEQAALNFSRAVDLKSDFVDAYRMRARVYLAQYNPDFAIRDFDKVLSFNPNDASALVEQGFARLDKKDYQNAIADADKALAVQPNSSRAYTLRATARRALGNTDQAIQDFTMAIKVEPNLENYFQRASTYATMGKPQLAIPDFDSAMGFDPLEPHIYFARAQARAAVGDSKGAQEDIAAGRKIDGW